MKNRKCIQGVYLSIAIILLLGFTGTVSAAAKKFAVPSTGSEMNSPVSQETGRAPFFLFFDDKGIFLEAVTNPAANQSGGISRTVVALLVKNNVTTVIADSIGDKMKKALADHHIDIEKGTGSAHDVIQSILLK